MTKKRTFKEANGVNNRDVSGSSSVLIDQATEEFENIT
jgi:hypothetical protein